MLSSSSWSFLSKLAKRSAPSTAPGTAPGTAPRAAAHRAIEALESRLYRDSSPWAWNAVMIHQDQAVADFPWLTGTGQTVVVLDTGVDMTHPSFRGKTLTYWQDFLSTKSPSATPIDTIGHGTGV